MPSGRKPKLKREKWRKSRRLPVDLGKAGLGARTPAVQARLPPSLSPVSAWVRGTPLRSCPPPPSASARTRGPQLAAVRHGGRAGRDVRQPAAGTPAARTSRRGRAGRPHPASDGAPQSQQHAGGRAGSVFRGAGGGGGGKEGEKEGGRGPSSAAPSPLRFPPRRPASPRWSARTT